MNSLRVGMVIFAALAPALSGCGGSAPAEGEPVGGQGDLHAQPPPSPVIDWQEIEERVAASVDSVDGLLRRVPNLTGAEQGNLRRDVNAVHTARARALGVRVGSDVERLVESGRLVRLADSTRYWVVDDLHYSVPYVTPSTHALLVEMGERWAAALDSLDLPPFRMIVTSVLRTSETQARLRRANPNAAAGVSSHEFGTTIDIAYRRFAAPARALDPAEFDLPETVQPQLQVLSDSLLSETARLRGTELQAVLGRVLLEMRREGKLLVIMERAQTVYHITVARRLESRGPVSAE